MTKQRRRRQFRESEMIEMLIVHQHVVILCHRCGHPLTADDVKLGRIQKEHLHEHALDGPDEPGNCRLSHTDCHKVVTFGTPATTAGSSAHRIAKATQPKRIEKFRVNKTPLDSGAPIITTERCRRCGEYSTDCLCSTNARQQRRV